MGISPLRFPYLPWEELNPHRGSWGSAISLPCPPAMLDPESLSWGWILISVGRSQPLVSSVEACAHQSWEGDGTGASRLTRRCVLFPLRVGLKACLLSNMLECPIWKALLPQYCLSYLQSALSHCRALANLEKDFFCDVGWLCSHISLEWGKGVVFLWRDLSWKLTCAQLVRNKSREVKE